MTKERKTPSTTKTDVARATPEPASLPAETAAAAPEMAVAAPDDWNEPGAPETPYPAPDEAPELATPEPASLPGEPEEEEEIEYIMDFLTEEIAEQAKPRIAVRAIQHLRFVEPGNDQRLYQLDEFKPGLFILRQVSG